VIINTTNFAESEDDAEAVTWSKLEEADSEAEAAASPYLTLLGSFKVTIIDPIIGSIIFTIMSFLETIFD